MTQIVPETLPPSELKSCCAGLYELPITSLLLGDSFHPGGPNLTRRLAHAAVVGRGTRVLDVACGKGDTARLLARHFGAQVVGLDYSESIVQEAGQLTAAEGLTDSVRFIRGDAEDLPLPDGGFDVVVCECAMCTFPDMDTAMSEAHRVLAPRGRLAISDVVIEQTVPDSLQNLMGHVLCLAGALPEADYVQALERAGFRSVRARDESQTLVELVDRIDLRVRNLRRLSRTDQHLWPKELDDPTPTLAAAREFIEQRGAGYFVFVGRR